MNLQLFAHKLIKWLPGECANWFFDNIMTWSFCLHRQYSMSWQKNSFLINEHALNRETFPLTLPGYNRISTKTIFNHINQNWLWLKGFRLRVVPHFSSGIVERAKCERAWKSPHARKGDVFLSPRGVSPFLAWGDFHALAFRSLCYPWEKMGDYS